MRIKLAELIIDIGRVNSNTRSLCRGYEYTGEGQTDFSVYCTKEALDSEAAKYPSMPYEYGENLCIYREICKRAVNYGAMLIHSAAVALDGEGYLFTALSGTGKTTHIRLWEEKFAGRVSVINGDKPIIRRADGAFHVYGTPWCGKEGENTNTHVPIKGICILQRGEKNTIERVTAQEAAAKLMEQTVRPTGAREMSALLGIIDELICEVPVYRLFCTPTPEAAEVSYNAMSGKG